MSLRWKRTWLAIGLCSAGACAVDSSTRRGHSGADSLAAAQAMCESLVKDKLLSPTVASFGNINMKRDAATNAFVGRGEATSPNPLNVPITHRFVCVIDIDKAGRGNVIFRNTNRELYEEMVRLMGL